MSEERESRRIWWIAGGILAAILAWRFVPTLENPLAPKPVAAYVALLVDGATAASDGPHRIEAGKAFRLFAVLEAHDWRSGTIWYTEAPALRLGGRAIPAASLRRWPASRRLSVRWLTVEGFAPYLEVGKAADLERFTFVEQFHPEWGSGWSADGVVDPKNALLPADSPLRPLAFGTQRYAVRIELFADERALTPEARWSSPAAGATSADAPAGVALVAALPRPLATVSAALGRTQLEPSPALDEETAKRLVVLHERSAAFVATRLWAEHLAESKRSAESLVWRPVDVAAGDLVWDRDVATGDLLQAGERLVILFRDAGSPARLDPADLVFDAARGLRILRLDEVFRGEGGLQVELARLGG